MIFPNEYKQENGSKAEAYVYQVLNRLYGKSENMQVFHSSVISNRERKRSECEIDFILLSEKFILCVEVKGGLISYDPLSQFWTQNSRPLADPVNQAIANQHAFIDRFRDNLNDIQVFWAVCFPDMELKSNALPPQAQVYNIIGAQELNYIEHYIQDVEAQAYKLRSEGVFPPRAARYAQKQIYGVLTRGLNIEPTIRSRFAEEGHRYSALFKDQLKAIEAVSGNPRVLVEGPAGSGKSLIGLHQIFHRYEQGDKVLFLTFNKALAKNLGYKAEKEYSYVKEDFAIRTFHSWAKRLIHAVEPNWWEAQEHNQDFWNLEVAAKLAELVPQIKERYDFIVVDEAQDFEDLWLEPVQGLLEANGRLSVLIDANQDIFGRLNSFQSLGFVTYKLSRVIRCSKAITSFIAKECANNITAHDSCPQGMDVIDLRSSGNDLHERLNGLLKEKGIPIDLLVVLYDSEAGLGKMEGFSVGRKKLVKTREGRARKNEIAAASIKQYKGLEKEVVVIANYDNMGQDTLRYVALSRAQNLLIIS